MHVLHFNMQSETFVSIKGMKKGCEETKSNIGLHYYELPLPLTKQLAFEKNILKSEYSHGWK